MGVYFCMKVRFCIPKHYALNKQGRPESKAPHIQFSELD